MRSLPPLPRRLWAGLLLALLVSGSAHGQAQVQPQAPALPLRMLAFPSPGLFDVAADGTIGGPGGALLNKISQASGMSFQTQAMPVPRALATGLNQTETCLVGLMRTPDREGLFQWVGPLSSGALVVYGHPDEERPPRTLAELRGRTVVAIRESGPAMLLRELGVATQEVSGTVPALRMLQARRVEFWFSHAFIAEAAAAAEGGTAIKAWFSTPKVEGYLACHPHIAPDLIERLQHAVQKLRRQGDLAEFGLR